MAWEYCVKNKIKKYFVIFKKVGRNTIAGTLYALFSYLTWVYYSDTVVVKVTRDTVMRCMPDQLTFRSVVPMKIPVIFWAPSFRNQHRGSACSVLKLLNATIHNTFKRSWYTRKAILHDVPISTDRQVTDNISRSKGHCAVCWSPPGAW